MNRTLLSLTLGTLLATVSVASAQDQSRADRNYGRTLPANLQSLKLPVPIERNSVSTGNLRLVKETSDDNSVIIRLGSPSVAEQNKKGKLAKEARKSIQDEQAELIGEVLALDPDARVLGQTQLVLNAVFIEADASIMDELAGNPNVRRITPVANYELDLSETVPYIGASAVQADGVDGSGVRVAVLDSGIDYTHANFGGGGTLADYAAAWGAGVGDPLQTTRDGLFPTAKVVEGYDFVGELWPTFGPLTPDNDPIDFGTHGSHVADIIGGAGGVAPGVDLYAVKVCSAVSTSCSGVALILGMEYAVDPDGDGDPSDAVDIINMSLGSDYGQPFDDDLAAAVDNATSIGVLTVASAGNGGDKPYISGTPASAATALSVAQTQVPSAALQLIDVDGDDYPAVFQPWSVAPGGTIIGPVAYGDPVTNGNKNGCAPFANPLTGLVVLVDRGACNFTLKVKNIADAGGVVGIIGLTAPGDPFSGGDGGDPVTIPGYMISQADSNAIKAQLGLPGVATIDPLNTLPLVGQMVGSSSRGPQHESTTLIKPEIGAPGASVSAIAGTGTGEGAFGGTSGAAPMVAGSAALLLQASPLLSPLEAKATLMNNGETDIDTDPFQGLAPITRIGGGEVRIDRAVAAPAAAWEDKGNAGSVSFGFMDVSKKKVSKSKKVRVQNYSDSDITYEISSSFRFANDAANGAVSIDVPKSVKVKKGKSAKFSVKLSIDGEKLRGNHMNSGSEGANPVALTLNEYDGYITLDDGVHPIHLPWHVLPRQAAEVKTSKSMKFKDGTAEVKLDNKGVGIAQNDAFALVATSENQPEGALGQQSPTPDIRAVGVNTFIVPAGVCSSEFLWTFAINTWERQQHLLPVSFWIELDAGNDGSVDAIVLNRDLSGTGTITDGRQVTYALNVNTNALTAWFFAENATNTGNTVLYVCGEQLGLSSADILTTNVGMTVFADDFYFGGPGDVVSGIVVTPYGEQYLGLPVDLAGGEKGSMDVLDFGPFPGNTPEEGILLFTNGDRGAGLRGGATEETEALLITVKDKK